MSAKIDLNHIEIGVHAYLSNGYLNPVSKLNFEKVDKSAYFHPWFDQPLSLGKISPSLINIGVHTYFSNGYLNPLSKLNSEKFELEPRKKSLQSHKNRSPCLSLKWVSKSTLKFKF